MKVLIATPAVSFTPSYVSSIVETLSWASRSNIEIVFHTRAGSNINELRECMMQDIHEHPGQLPDKIFWIDSDVSWLVSDFVKILSSPFSLTCGAYLTNTQGQLSVAKKHNVESSLVPYDCGDIDSLGEYQKIFASGFGFICMDADVVEKIGPPWFHPVHLTPEQDGLKDHICTSEDTAFCMRANRLGIDIFWDTDVLVGHEKSTLWLPTDNPRSRRAVGIESKRIASQWVKNLSQEQYEILDSTKSSGKND